MANPNKTTTTTPTPATANQNGSAKTKQRIQLPLQLSMEIDQNPIIAEKGKKSNPLTPQIIAGVTNANSDRKVSWSVRGPLSMAQARKVANMLRSAAREIGCGLRVTLKNDKNEPITNTKNDETIVATIEYRAIDMVTRTPKDK